MECTFNDLSGFPSSTGNCNNWPSKHKYSSIAIGYAIDGGVLNTEGTGYEILYIDFPADIISQPNQNHEGGIRPPC